MPPKDWQELAAYLLALIALTPPLAAYAAAVMEGAPHPLLGPLGWLERGLYRLGGVDPDEPMDWKAYAWAVIVFHALGLAFLLVLLLLQGVLPLNPGRVPGMAWPLALNTAVSFVTNTNWQAYAGETAVSTLSQMLGLTVQNFLSAATGVAGLTALARGLRARQASSLGSFWADLVRATVYIFLPLSFVLALFLAAQGVPQTFAASVRARTLEGAEQVIPLGPVASQEAIKQLGTNGGGYFGVNSAHPFENPTPFSNFLEMLAILLLPSALAVAFGRMVGERRHGWALWAAMALLFGLSLSGALWAEFRAPGAPLLEGKELRFGVMNSVLWSQATSAASNGSVNAMLSSLSPAAGGLALFNILLGEVAFGGVGCGAYGMVLFALIAVFLAGLMVGRTPEYLGKRVESREIILALLASLLPGALVLVLSAWASFSGWGRAGLLHAGPHGLSEILYAFASQANNNGSAFAGLNAAGAAYCLLGSLAMLAGRFGVLIPVLALAGGMAAKKRVAASAGTFPTDGPLFTVLLAAVVLLVGALTFFPALILGPGLEQLLFLAQRPL